MFKLSPITHKKNSIILRCICICISAGLISLLANCSTPISPYKNATLSAEERVEDLLSRMSLEEKINQLHGIGFDTKENNRLEIPVLKMSDGPVGVRWGQATAFPSAVGIAATWNPQIAQDIGKIIAVELKSKGRNYLLGPCVNIHRYPLGGRNFESYGEDPLLASRIAVDFIKGVQSQNILACVKHYACNNQEWERHKLDVTIDERGLREIYLPAFKASVTEGNVRTVMAAYNKFRGENCSESNHLLNTILKKEWKFKGFVVSDWRSTYSTKKAAEAGLDLEMPWGEFFEKSLLKAVKEGKVKEEIIDDKIRRLMRVRFEAGLFETKPVIDEKVILRDSHKKLALDAAKESMVLLKNKPLLLPLDVSKIKSIALIGPNAAIARTGGGGSSMVNPYNCISPLEAFQQKYGDTIQIYYTPGIAVKGDILPIDSHNLIPSKTLEGREGLWAEYFSNTAHKGHPVMARLDKSVDFNWGYDAPHPKLHRVDDRNLFSIRWTGTITPIKNGVHKLNIIHNDGIRLFIDDKKVIDNWKKNKIICDSTKVELKKGKTYSIKLEYFFEGGISIAKLGWEIPGYNGIQEAANIASQSDVAIIITGLHERFESEAFDRPHLELPNQDKLIEAVIKANPNTIVVVQTGSPIRMPWAERVPAILQSWYPGEEGGNAIADVLTGKYNPSGKLPFSYISSYEQSPAFNDYQHKSLKSPYPESIYVGYRYLEKYNHTPLFPFGHGLSYTTFTYSNLRIEQKGKHTFNILADIKNSGNKKGSEVVQLYIGDKESELERPPKELKGFKKIELQPGETKTVSIPLKKDSFAYYHPQKNGWIVEPGEFEILIGSSSQDIRLSHTLRIK